MSATTVQPIEPELPVEPTSQFKPSAYKPGDVYVWQEGDNIWDVARLLGTKAKQLMEFNEMEDPDELLPGDPIHVPIIKPVKPLPEIRYELLDDPLPMHVSKMGGTKKWSFGHAKTWDDISSTGFFPENTNVTITAIAYVPIEEDGETKEAAYYMDELAVGSFRETGRVRYTIGYSWSDLEKGHVEAKKPEHVAQQAIIQEEAPPEAPLSMDIKALNKKKAEFKEMIAKEAIENPDKYPNYYKSTYQRLDPPVDCIAMLPKDMDFIWVKEHDGRRPERKLVQHQEIVIAGTFEHLGTLYGRPIASAHNGYWYGIPMDMLQSQADLYNNDVPAEDRAQAHGTLTLMERFIWVPIAKTIHHPLVRRFRQSKNKKKE